MTPSYPFTRRQALAGAVLLLLALAIGGRWLTRPGSAADALAVAPVVPAASAAAATAPQPPAPAPEVVVDVVGAVATPGLYRLEEGSRIADAVARAGGATRKANLAAVNLAAPLVDGTQVVVPRRGQQIVPPAAAGAGATGAAPTGPIHLNTATAGELETIPGVGPVTAQRILDFREQNGPFRSVDELDAVSGIGPKRLEQLRGLVAP
jgi:competence protein ComEA